MNFLTNLLEQKYGSLSPETTADYISDVNELLDTLCQTLENGPAGIFLSQNDKCLWWNNRMSEITGYSKTEADKFGPMDLVFPADRMGLREKALRMLKGETNIPLRFRILEKSGNPRWVKESLASIRIRNERALLGILTDISEDDCMTQAFRNAPIGIYILSGGKFVFSNNEFRKITGFDEDELSKAGPSDIVFPEDRQLVKQKALAMLKGLEEHPYPFRIRKKNGEIRHILESVSSIGYKGKLAVLGNFMDITDSMRAEKSLKESEQQCKILQESSQLGIVIVDYEDGKILDANTTFLEMTGFDMESIRQMRIWESQPDEFQEEARQSFFRFHESPGGIVSWKLCRKRKKGCFSVEISAKVISMNDRRVIQCILHDITEREFMIRALSRASEEWRNSFDAIEDVVLLIASDYRIERANLSAARLLGIDAQSLLGEKCYKVVHGTDSPPDYCPLGKCRESGKPEKTEAEEFHLGRTLRFSSSPMKDETGKLLQTVEIISDVTRRRNQEKESARLSEILAESFEGITESLSDLVESRDPYTAGHSRHVANLSVMAGKKLGLGENELQGLRVCAILHDIGKVIIPAAILNKPGRLSEHEWGLIRSHPSTAYESLKHIPFPWPVADVVNQHHERLDGSGYPNGLKERDIHPWAKIIAVADLVDAITSHRPYRPSLPRENALSELIKGRGTLYDITVADVFINAMRLEDKRVMVVDDDVPEMEALVRVLSLEGLDASGFREPAAALEAFRKKPFPLVITELNLKEMDGAVLTRKLKETFPRSEIIVATKFGAKEETLRALRAGASDFLEKPLDLEIIRKSVNRALHRFAGKKDIG